MAAKNSFFEKAANEKASISIKEKSIYIEKNKELKSQINQIQMTNVYLSQTIDELLRDLKRLAYGEYTNTQRKKLYDDMKKQVDSKLGHTFKGEL